MSILQLALLPEGLRDFTRPGAGLPGVEAALRAGLATLSPGAPVVILLHGMGYRPGKPGDCPHGLLFAERRTAGCARHLPWPRRLGLSGLQDAAPRGLAVGFGWDGHGTLWAAARSAERSASQLARVVTLIRRIAPDRSVDLIGHSLGARVMLGALPHLHAGAVGRMILMAGAEFRDRAGAALDTPAGRTAEVINVISRENDLFDWMFETALAPLSSRSALGVGLGDLPNAVDIQIDGQRARDGLARLGFRLPGPRVRVCHWSVYLRPGVFRLYRQLLFRREDLTLERLRAALAAPPEPRWSRLTGRNGRGRAHPPLPFEAHGPSLPA